jgi:hypothetical protein
MSGIDGAAAKGDGVAGAAVGVAVGAGADAEADGGGVAAGVVTGAGFGAAVPVGRVGRGGGGAVGAGVWGAGEPSCANSSENIHTLRCPGDPAPVQYTPGALSAEPAPMSVYAGFRMLLRCSGLFMNCPLM